MPTLGLGDLPQADVEVVDPGFLIRRWIVQPQGDAALHERDIVSAFDSQIDSQAGGNGPCSADQTARPEGRIEIGEAPGGAHGRPTRELLISRFPRLSRHATTLRTRAGSPPAPRYLDLGTRMPMRVARQTANFRCRGVNGRLLSRLVFLPLRHAPCAHSTVALCLSPFGVSAKSEAAKSYEAVVVSCLNAHCCTDPFQRVITEQVARSMRASPQTWRSLLKAFRSRNASMECIGVVPTVL